MINEEAIHEKHTAKIVVTPIGGQGYLFGWENHQISPKVLRKVSLDNVIEILALEKNLSLDGQPLLVDTGDSEIDNAFRRHIKVITGYGERIMYPVAGDILREI